MKRAILTAGLLFAALAASAKGADTILDKDPVGIYVTIVSVVTVLSALIVLFLLIQLFGVTSVHLTTESRHAKSQISSDLLCFFTYILPRFSNVIVLSLRLGDRSFFGKIYCIKINIFHMLLTSLYKLVQPCIIFIINGCQFLCQFFFLNLHLLAKSIQICIKIP